MTQAWVILTGRDGRDISAPTEHQLATALSELFGPGRNESGSAILRFGYADGLMYQAEIYSTGEILFEEWSDKDCEIALAEPRRMTASMKEALQIWCMLARRQVTKIRDLAWSTA
jgi:hypothetical protein